MSFKQKETRVKKPTGQTSTSLQTIHNEKIKKFSNDDAKVLALDADIEAAKSILQDLDGKELKTLEELAAINETRDRLKSYMEERNRIVHQSDVMDYYFMAGDIIDEYNNLSSQTNNKVNITDFFKRDASIHRSNRKSLLDQYLELVQDDHVVVSRNQSLTACKFCNEEMIIKTQAGTYICVSCGVTHSVLVDGEQSRNSSGLTESPRYSIYQRKNHFKEWLIQLQAKETTEIPAEVIEMILVELHKIHFTNLAELDHHLIRKILKKLGLSKYYENIFHIIYRLNGLQPPTLSRETEEQLLCYFKQIEDPFRLYKKKNRKNILRYSFILYKLCELLDLDSFLPCFRLLKNRSKLMEQDAVWKMICEHLQWEFIPSL
jgi:hypothetical protein